MEQSALRGLDLNEIAVFARVVQAGSFTRAARDLGLPKSTVSRKVTALEERLAARLLQRTTRRLGLTDAGRAFFDYAARIVADAEEASRAVNQLQAVPRGLLRVTAPVSLGFLSSLFSSFLTRYPEVEIDLACTDRVVNLVDEGFDVALRAGRLADSSLVSRPLASIGRFVVASPRYLAGKKPPDSPEALKQHACVVFGPAAPRNTWRLFSGKRKVELTVRPRIVVNDVDIVHELALAGHGIALLPEHTCVHAFRTRRLVRVLPDWRASDTEFHVVYPSTRHLSPKVRAFVDHLTTAMKAGEFKNEDKTQNR